MPRDFSPIDLWRTALKFTYDKILRINPPEAMRDSAKQGWLLYQERIRRMSFADLSETVIVITTLNKDGLITVTLFGEGRSVVLTPNVDYTLDPSTRQIELVKPADDLWGEKT